MKIAEENSSKETILSVAEELFAINGFDGTSLRNIAAGTGLNTSMISYYFGSKSGLYRAIILCRVEEFNTVFKKFEITRPNYNLGDFLTRYIAWIERNRNFFVLINRKFSFTERPGTKKDVEEALNAHFLYIERIIAKAVEKLPLAHMDATLTYLVIFGLLQASMDSSPLKHLITKTIGHREPNAKRIHKYLTEIIKQPTFFFDNKNIQ